MSKGGAEDAEAQPAAQRTHRIVKHKLQSPPTRRRCAAHRATTQRSGPFWFLSRKCRTKTHHHSCPLAGCVPSNRALDQSESDTVTGAGVWMSFFGGAPAQLRAPPPLHQRASDVVASRSRRALPARPRCARSSATLRTRLGVVSMRGAVCVTAAAGSAEDLYAALGVDTNADGAQQSEVETRKESYALLSLRLTVLPAHSCSQGAEERVSKAGAQVSPRREQSSACLLLPSFTLCSLMPGTAAGRGGQVQAHQGGVHDAV